MTRPREGARRSEIGKYDRCIVVIEGDQCARTDVVSYGVCRTHYNQKRRTGTYSKIRENYRTKGALRDKELAEWIVAQGIENGQGCSVWPYATSFSDGYGSITAERANGTRGTTGTHRVVARWLLNDGVPLDPGEVVHHMCANKTCNRPEHLAITTASHNTAEALMRKENVRLRERVAELEALVVSLQKEA